MDKYRQFLGDIVREIRKAKQGNFSQDEFFRRTRSQLRAMDYGELIQLWEHEKEKFWECVSLDPNIVTMRMRRNAIDKINLFSRLTERKLIQFSDEEQKTTEEVMTLLSELQNSNELTSTANAADLAILADCLVYKSTRLAQGVMYLVTGDNELIKATDEVVNNPHLINPDYDPEHVMPGLKPLRPRDFLVGIKRVI